MTYTQTHTHTHTDTAFYSLGCADRQTDRQMEIPESLFLGSCRSQKCWHAGVCFFSCWKQDKSWQVGNSPARWSLLCSCFLQHWIWILNPKYWKRWPPKSNIYASNTKSKIKLEEKVFPTRSDSLILIKFHFAKYKRFYEQKVWKINSGESLENSHIYR